MKLNYFSEARMMRGVHWWIGHVVAYWVVAAIINDKCPSPLTPHVVRTQVILNQLVVTLPWLCGIDWLLDSHSSVQPWTWIPAAILLDFGFWAAHRLAHTRRFFAQHRLHHTLRSAYAPAAAYCSPAEQAFVNLLPASIPPLLFGWTALEVHAWILLGTLDVLFAHSRFSFGHDAHHFKKTVAFGSSLGLADKILCTNDQNANRPFPF